jgi:adenylosuccinate lyase
MDEVYYLNEKFITKVTRIGGRGKNIALLARTHGQRPSPPVGKEKMVFVYRLEKQFHCSCSSISGKSAALQEDSMHIR